MNPFDEHDADEISRTAYAYWDKARGHRVCPSRNDIHPEEIPAILPHIVLNDVVSLDPPRFRYRLIGTRVVSYYGEDWTGRYFDEIAEGSFHASVTECFLDVIANRRPRYDVLEGVWPSVTFYSRLSLPLSEDDATVNMILACVVASFDGAQKRSFAETVLGKPPRPQSF